MSDKWRNSTHYEPPESIFVPTGVLNDAAPKAQEGETNGLVLTASDLAWYDDDIPYIRADIYEALEVERDELLLNYNQLIEAMAARGALKRVGDGYMPQ